MGNHKRYIGVRLYLSASETEVEKSSEASVDVQPHAMGMGSNSISIKARREHYKDSRLIVLRGSSCDNLVILSKVAGLSITAAAIAAATGHWKGYAVSGIIFTVGCGWIFKDCARRYWDNLLFAVRKLR